MYQIIPYYRQPFSQYPYPYHHPYFFAHPRCSCYQQFMIAAGGNYEYFRREPMTQYSLSYSIVELPFGDISDLQWRMVWSLQKEGYRGVQRVEDHHTFPPNWEVLGDAQIAKHAVNFNDGTCEFWIWYEEGPDSQHFREYVYMTCPWGVSNADWRLSSVVAKLHRYPDLGEYKWIHHYTSEPRPLPGYER